MRIENEVLLDYSDVLIRPKRSALESRQDVLLTRNYTFRNSKQTYSGIPIMAANMDTIGTFEVAEKLKQFGLFTCLHKHYQGLDWDNNYKSDDLDSVAISIGTSDDDYNKLEIILFWNPSIKYICIDVANGYTERFVDFVRKVRNKHPSKVLIAGNVVTGDMTQELILAGADVIKVGIGQGSVCSTRIKTGVGYPQLSAVIECADAAHGLGAHIIADGGCSVPGDIAKAFGAGADFVMLGGMLAGCDESVGEHVEKSFLSGELDSKTGQETVEKKVYKKFYGMSSSTAQDKHNGGLSEYRASEGKTILVPEKGPVDAIIKDILGGLRSACTYTGAASLKDLSKCTTFVRVNNQYNRVYDKHVIGD